MSCTNPLVASFTVEDFKMFFYRDFNYLPVWKSSSVYNAGDLVFYDVNGLFYTCKNANVSSVPTTTADWLQTAGNKYDYVLDEDIEKAFDEACPAFNSRVSSDTTTIKLLWMYLTAHFLVMDTRAGGTKSTGVQKVASRSVGNVSESYTMPEWALKNPFYSFLSSTYYGYKYFTLVYPFLKGNISYAMRTTNA